MPGQNSTTVQVELPELPVQFLAKALHFFGLPGESKTQPLVKPAGGNQTVIGFQPHRIHLHLPGMLNAVPQQLRSETVTTTLLQYQNEIEKPDAVRLP